MKDDDIIESFFEGMKKADGRVPVPPFEKPIKHEKFRSSNWLYYAAAMVAAILVSGVFLIRSSYDDQKKEEIPFSDLYPTETGSLLYTDEMTMSDWQSPTDGLLKDF